MSLCWNMKYRPKWGVKWGVKRGGKKGGGFLPKGVCPELTCLFLKYSSPLYSDMVHFVIVGLGKLAKRGLVKMVIGFGEVKWVQSLV